MVDTGNVLLIAGHETTVNLITNGMLTLLRHPDVLQRCWSRSCCAMNHRSTHCPTGGRWPTSTSPAPRSRGARTSSCCSHLGTGTRPGSATPSGFDADRLDNQHLGFGSGIRHCFGAPWPGWRRRSRSPSSRGGSRTRGSCRIPAPTERHSPRPAPCPRWDRRRARLIPLTEQISTPGAHRGRLDAPDTLAASLPQGRLATTLRWPSGQGQHYYDWAWVTLPSRCSPTPYSRS